MVPDERGGGVAVGVEVEVGVLGEEEGWVVVSMFSVVWLCERGS